MQGDDYLSTYPYNGGDGNDYTASDAGAGGGGGKIVTSGCAECYNCLSLSGGGGGESSCSDNEGTTDPNASFADTIDAADLDLETRGDRNTVQSSYLVSQQYLIL